MSRLAVLASLLAICAACSEKSGNKATCGDCLPDLAVDEGVLAAGLRLEQRTFTADSCEVSAGCAAAPGERLVLELAAAVRNVGEAPLQLDEQDFGSNRCGGEPVLADFLRWRILDADGTPLLEGSSDLGCLADGSAAGGGEPHFTCTDRQGLQPGWVHDAPAEGTCTFADLTDLPPGDYLLELAVNGSGALTEKRSDNNEARVPFAIPEEPCDAPLCGGFCCPDGVECLDGKCALPDLAIDEEALLQSIRIDEANFAADDCAVDEACVGDVGDRRLLRFTLSTPNIGGADLFVGDPDQASEAEWSACHEHFHMLDFANYRLLTQDGDVAAVGHKQAFCLMDTEPWGDDGPTEAQYDCEYQGISRGWSDSYGSGLDCQWVDITGVPEGDYLLDIVVNGAGRYPEITHANNQMTVPVFIPGDPTRCIPVEEVCGDGRDQDCDGVPDDGCPPLTENDSCRDAWLLDGSGTWTGSIDDTTGREGGGSCGGSGGALHFSLTVLSEEIIYVSTYGSEIDTVLRIEEGACGSTAEVSCTDDACGEAGSHFAGPLAPGSYDIVVQAKEATASGEVQLHVQRSGCNGASLIDAPGSYEGDTSDGGLNNRTSCGLGGGPDEFWYFATCPGQTQVELSTCGGSSYDTVLELRQSSCRGRAVGCNDDALSQCGSAGGSRIEGPLEGQGLWFLLVDGYLSTDGGPYHLDASW